MLRSTQVNWGASYLIKISISASSTVARREGTTSTGSLGHGILFFAPIFVTMQLDMGGRGKSSRHRIRTGPVLMLAGNGGGSRVCEISSIIPSLFRLLYYAHQGKSRAGPRPTRGHA